MKFFRLPFSNLRVSPSEIIGRELTLVKTLHPIDEISASISLDEGRRVRLAREMDDAAARKSRQQSCDPIAAVIGALAEPLDFPPLAAGIVPGDRVAIAVDEAVPCVGDVVRGAVESLQTAGLDPEAISIVTADSETSLLCRAAFSGDGASGPHFVVHDPDDNDSLCMVGVTKQLEPVLINRTIFDADVVLPIGCARLGGCGAYESLFPRFSDAQTIQRFRAPIGASAEECDDDRIRETDEAGWLVGVMMVVEVVPGAGETVAQVVAGAPQTVARRSEQLCRGQWQMHSPQQVSLVIATITGGAQTQRWTNVGRALAMAENLLVEDGAVAICSNLERPPGESLGRLIGSTDLAKTQRKILHDQAEDSWPAWQLARALQRGPVYFLSQLDAETVEDMGLAPIADIDELARLASRHESFIVVEDSQHTVVAVDGE